MTNVCQQNIGVFLGRDIGQWSGLATGCRKEDLSAWLSFNAGEGRAVFGAKHVEYEFRTLTCDGFRENLTFYFRNEELSLIATEFWSFDSEESARLLQQLGDPTHRLDFFWRDEKIENGEWVYVDRGITLGVIPTTQLIAKVMVYPPGTLTDYKESYYDTTLVRELRKTR
jgi:hypothetical protein